MLCFISGIVCIVSVLYAVLVLFFNALNFSPLSANQIFNEDTLVLKIASVSMAPQADNPLSRSVLRKDIYQ